MSKLNAEFSVAKMRDEINAHYKGMSYVALNCDKYFGLTTRTTKDWKKSEDEAKAASIKEERTKAVEAIRATPKPRKKCEKGPVKVKEPNMKKLMTERLKKLKEKKLNPEELELFKLKQEELKQKALLRKELKLQEKKNNSIEDVTFDFSTPDVEEEIFDLSTPNVELALNLETDELIEISPDLSMRV